MNRFTGPWIDPNERRPREGERVLICREKEKGELVVEQAWLTKGGWWKIFGTNCKRIVAWMPMPKPPAPMEED